MTSLVDTHVHLDDPQFDPDRAEVLASAREAGVAEMIHIGYRPEQWASSLNLISTDGRLSCALGVHPGNAHEAVDEDLDRLAQLATSPGVVAIGEIGLDRYWTTETADIQMMWFRRQLDLAASLDLPVVIHQRSAAAEVHAVLAALNPQLLVVLHSFDGDPALARLSRERGYLVGVGGLMTRASSGDLRDVLRTFPLDQIVLETDAPYLVPTGVKSRRNSPALLPLIASRLAELRGSTVEEIAGVTTATARSRLLRRQAEPTSSAVPVA